MYAHPRLHLSTSTSGEAEVVSAGVNTPDLVFRQDLWAPSTNQAGHKNKFAGGLMSTTANPPISIKDVLSSRSERIKGLKLRDLADERAARRRSGGHTVNPDGKAVLEETLSSAEDETASPTPQLSEFPLVPSRPSVMSLDPDSTIPLPESHQSNARKQESFHCCCGPPARVGHQTSHSTMSQSQLIVLAETDPATQMFSASTPSSSFRKTGRKKVDPLVLLTRDRKMGGRRDKASHRDRKSNSGQYTENPGTSANGEHTPPHSIPSARSSGEDEDEGDGFDSLFQHPSYKDNHHHAAVAKDRHHFHSVPAVRTFAQVVRKEDRKYVQRQQHLNKMRWESSELKVAIRLLNRGLEKLTTVVDGCEFVHRPGGLEQGVNAEIAEELAIGSKPTTTTTKPTGFGRTLSTTVRESSDLSHTWPTRVNEKTRETNDKDQLHRGIGQRAKSVRANDARPLSLVSRYSSARNRMGDFVTTRSQPPAKEIKAEPIWSQEGLDQATVVAVEDSTPF